MKVVTVKLEFEGGEQRTLQTYKSECEKLEVGKLYHLGAFHGGVYEPAKRLVNYEVIE
jgi:hypothetical protein